VSETASADSTEKLSSLHHSEKVSSQRNGSAEPQQSPGDVKHGDNLTALFRETPSRMSQSL